MTTGLFMGLLGGVWHIPMFAGSTDPNGTVPAAFLVAVSLFAWPPRYRVLMVWVYDRTASLFVAMLMQPAHLRHGVHPRLHRFGDDLGIALLARSWCGCGVPGDRGSARWVDGGHLTRPGHRS